MPERYPNSRVVTYVGPFNFSAVNNLGARFAKGEHLLLLNNDIEVLSHDFLRELLSYSQRPDVGAVGLKALLPDDTTSHAGVIMGINGSAGHSHKSYPRKAVGDLYRLVTTQDYMAVTGACLNDQNGAVPRGGRPGRSQVAVAYNDVDYCLKLWQKGLLNVYTPRAEAYLTRARAAVWTPPRKTPPAMPAKRQTFTRSITNILIIMIRTITRISTNPV